MIINNICCIRFINDCQRYRGTYLNIEEPFIFNNKSKKKFDGGRTIQGTENAQNCINLISIYDNSQDIGKLLLYTNIF